MVAEHLYQTMMADLIYCQMKELGEMQEVECCFQICNNYLTRLKSEMNGFDFESVEDEIFYFKKIRPLFICEIEYYALIHHAQLFKDQVNDNTVLKKFWDRESKRLGKFKEDNREFCHYLAVIDSSYHKIWFTKEGEEYSNLLGRLWALEKYHGYVEGQMTQLG